MLGCLLGLGGVQGGGKMLPDPEEFLLFKAIAPPAGLPVLDLI